jgi:two-component system KDP operon response regulator KdpE
MKILIIEDDYNTVEAISLSIQVGWPEAKLISTKLGDEGIDLVEKELPNIVILDLGLPDMSGFDVLKRIRLFSIVPIIILTARESEADVIKGLEWGANEYIIKPFRQLELLARIKSILRMFSASVSIEFLYFGNFKFDVYAHKLIVACKEIPLTNIESNILYKLLINKNQTVTLDSLAEAIWGDNYPGANESIRVHICNLREKIEADPSRPRFINTKQGVGYTFIQSD